MLAACGGSEKATEPAFKPPVIVDTDTIPLHVLGAQHGLRLGVAVDRGFRYTGTDATRFKALLTREFDVLTPENDMKFDALHPAKTTYRFTSADSLVTLAESNGMKVRGHTLVWHRQLASWLTSGTWTPAEARALLIDHVTQVTTHFRGHVLAWDVVNEALNDDGSYRPGFWLDNVGRDYIEQAFRTAHDADPTALLFYNDYNIEGINAKSDSAYKMISDLLQRGVPISGVGLQAHFQVGGVPSTLEQNITRFAALGLKVHITELDVRLQIPSTTATLQTQSDNYVSVLQACTRHPACDTIVFWGLTDKESWVPGAFPGWGEALIYDASYAKKLAFRGVYSALK